MYRHGFIILYSLLLIILVFSSCFCFCFIMFYECNFVVLCAHECIWVRVCDNVWVVNMHVHLWMLMSVHVEPKAGGGQSKIDNFLYYSFPCCFETFSHWNWSSYLWRSFRTSDWIHWHRQACHSVSRASNLTIYAFPHYSSSPDSCCISKVELVFLILFGNANGKTHYLRSLYLIIEWNKNDDLWNNDLF